MSKLLKEMSDIAQTILTAVCIAVFTAPLLAQARSQELIPDRPVTLTLSPDEARTFQLQMKEGDFAEINWLANEELKLSYAFLDTSGHALATGDSNEQDAAVFIAPRAGQFVFIIRYDSSSEAKGPQNISLEYKNKFILPAGSKQKDVRRINGYDVRIVFVPDGQDDFGHSVVIFEKGSKIKGMLRQGGNATFIGFSFPDNPAEAKTLAAKKELRLIRENLDKTGDGVPDVMIDYYSGGAHCCFSTYFVNLGNTVEMIERVDTGNAGLSPISLNPMGGLRFRTNENAFAYWNIHFAGSPMPEVILEFENGKLRPNFALMRKRPPSLALLRSKARAASLKISNDPYTEVGMDFEEAFWGEMLDLIYSGNEPLAWQYLDLVWPAKKPGKDKFLADFKEQLADSYYGTRAINTTDSVKNAMQLFEKIYKSIQEN